MFRQTPGGVEKKITEKQACGGPIVCAVQAKLSRAPIVLGVFTLGTPF